MYNDITKKQEECIFVTLKKDCIISIGDVIKIDFDNFTLLIDEIYNKNTLDNLEKLGKELVHIATLNRKILYETDYKKTNREKKREPKKGKFWCNYCDAQLVNEYAKCPICNSRNGRKRNKK